MGATHIQTGVVNHRINREPLDAESVMNSYEDLLSYVESTGNGTTAEGAFYAGHVTAVVNDMQSAYNGLYYISYGFNEQGHLAYTANRMASSYEVDQDIIECEETVYNTIFGWGHLT